MRVRLIALSAAVSFAASASAQHFAPPPPLDGASVPQIGEPLLTFGGPTTSFGSVVADNWLYVLGGYAGRPHDYNRDEQSDAFYRINLLSPDYVESLRNDQPIQSCPLEHWNGLIVRTGGLHALNAPGEDEVLRSSSSVVAFDPASGAWSDLVDLPGARSSHDTAIIGSHLYVVGGWALDSVTDTRAWAERMLVLDLANQGAGWSTVDVPFQKRARVGLVPREARGDRGYDVRWRGEPDCRHVRPLVG